ncbi:MAG TPA: urate hydroxylase PuuD [Anaeromyxobacteraceae bacterium]|nr:urate hydroxylase PuuD [Anaeromyxobacteraceae bacterium]
MDATSWLEALFRWTHVVAGVLWIGHLYFFNFVNGQVAKTYDADSKKKVLPELMPRALYWFRWGAAYTWATGILLAGIVYYSVDNLARKDVVTDAAVISHPLAIVISLALVVVVFFVYEAVLRALGKQEAAAAVVLYAILVAVLFGLSRIFTGRATFIHAGMLMGTVMAMNVWMRIWPAQKKIIQGVKGVAPAPDASIPAMAAMRSKQNTYMSVALLFTMVSNHYPTIYGADYGWVVLSVIVAVAFGATKLLYHKSAGPAPALYGAPAAAPAGGTPGMAAPKA